MWQWLSMLPWGLPTASHSCHPESLLCKGILRTPYPHPQDIQEVGEGLRPSKSTPQCPALDSAPLPQQRQGHLCSWAVCTQTPGLQPAPLAMAAAALKHPHH